MNKAVIFDMNGVIIDDERIHQESWRQLCKKYKVELTEEAFKNRVFGRTEKETLEYLFDYKLTSEEVAKYSNERVEIAIEIFKPQLALTDGLLKFLQELKDKNMLVAIATSSRIPYTNFILDNLDLRKFFHQIVTAENITNGKPDPEIYLLAAKRLGIEPQYCVVFEDTISGIKSGQAAGMKVVAIATTHNKEELAIADKVISSFKYITIVDLQNL